MQEIKIIPAVNGLVINLSSMNLAHSWIILQSEDIDIVPGFIEIRRAIYTDLTANIKEFVQKYGTSTVPGRIKITEFLKGNTPREYYWRIFRDNWDQAYSGDIHWETIPYIKTQEKFYGISFPVCVPEYEKEYDDEGHLIDVDFVGTEFIKSFTDYLPEAGNENTDIIVKGDIELSNQEYENYIEEIILNNSTDYKSKDNIYHVIKRGKNTFKYYEIKPLNWKEIELEINNRIKEKLFFEEKELFKSNLFIMIRKRVDYLFRKGSEFDSEVKIRIAYELVNENKLSFIMNQELEYLFKDSGYQDYRYWIEVSIVDAIIEIMDMIIEGKLSNGGL